MSGINYSALDRVEIHYRDIQKKFPSLSERYVPGEGDSPKAFIIGEAPGADEDVQLRPFVGRAGMVMRQLMRLAELYANPTVSTQDKNYANCWLTNVSKFRPPKKRKPLEVEVKAFRAPLFHEYYAVGAPKLIIPVGSSALYAVTGKHISILKTAGKAHRYTTKQGAEVTIFPMVHPSFAIRQNSEQLQELLEEDWERLGKWRSRVAD